LRRPPRPPTTLPGEISSALPGEVGALSASGASRLPLIYLEASSASSAIISGFVTLPPGTAEPEPPPRTLSSKPIETSYLPLHAALHLLRPKYRINSPHNLLVNFGRISMRHFLVALGLSALVISGAQAADSCKAQSDAKKLSGAAQTSFLKKCETDAKASCEK